MKNEMKLEFSNKKILENVIKKAYFEDGYLGKLITNKNHIDINQNTEIYSTLKGLNNVVVKISNPDVIDGYCRFIIDNTKENPKLFPISMYCVKDENKKYTFY